MQRLELQEIHDHPRFPGFLRDLVTDALQSLWNFGNSYEPVLARLLASMELAGTHEVLDLCSGGGGPWPRLLREPAVAESRSILVRLTDKYPNHGAFRQAGAASERLQFEMSPVDATRIPRHLAGFRTIFSSFHHFGPEAAALVLSDAVRQRRGVGIFEMAQRTPRTILTIFLIPALAWLLAPTIRPFRWSRLLWTNLVPVVPFVLFYDGIVSCLRAYSHEELQRLVAPLQSANYEWRIGEDRSGFLPLTYLLGWPLNNSTARANEQP